MLLRYVSSEALLIISSNAEMDYSISVLYEGNEEITYKFGECIPRELDDEHPFQMPVFCKAVTCKVYS